MPYKLAEAADVVLFRVYQYYTSTDDVGPFTVAGAGKFVKHDGVSPFLAKMGVELLSERKHVEFDEISEAYELTTTGIQFIENELDNPTSIIASVSGGSSANVGDDDIAAEAEVWEPLPIDRQAPAYEGAVSALEEAFETISGDNGYAANEPNERDQIVWSLKEGLRAIKDHLPSRGQVQSMVIAPLKFIAEKFATSAMGEAAKTVLPKLLGWLSGLGS